MSSVMSKRAGTMVSRTLSAMAGAVAVVVMACATGCQRPPAVPPFSQLVAEAPSQAASFQAPDDGTVYVDGPGTPGQTRHLAFSGLVKSSPWTPPLESC
jgi:hypothetical protein